jgi:hypothetical protein
MFRLRYGLSSTDSGQVDIGKYRSRFHLWRRSASSLFFVSFEKKKSSILIYFAASSQARSIAVWGGPLTARAPQLKFQSPDPEATPGGNCIVRILIWWWTVGTFTSRCPDTPPLRDLREAHQLAAPVYPRCSVLGALSPLYQR